MTTPLEAYQTYLAIKNHFSSPSYDYFKYQGKVKVNSQSFEKRKDKFFFQKLAKQPDVRNFLVANLSVNNKAWIKEIAYSVESEKIYKDWLKRQQSLSYIFKQDLGHLDNNFNNNFICKDNEHPLLLRLFLSNKISIETLCILLDFSGAKPHWNTKMKYDLVWEHISLRIEKYSPFIEYDKDKLKNIVVDFFGH